MGTAPENTEIAIEGLGTEVERLGAIKLSQEEVEGAKNKLLGQYALGKQTNGEIAQIYGWYETLGLGVDFDLHFPKAIAKVTPETIQEIAQTYLQNPFISIVRPE
jgi:predicted Zn-dependent peptidase